MRGIRIITLSLRPHYAAACGQSPPLPHIVRQRETTLQRCIRKTHEYMCFSRKAALYGREYHSRGSLAIDVSSARKRFFLQYLS